MSLAGCQINSIDVNFHLQKSLEIFDNNSADKNLTQKEQGNKSIMPVRIKRQKGQVGDPVASQIHITPF